MKTALNATLSGAAPEEEKKTETLRLQLLSRPAATTQETVNTAETFAAALASSASLAVRTIWFSGKFG